MATMRQAFGAMVGVFVEEYEEEGRDVDVEEVVGEVQTSVSFIATHKLEAESSLSLICHYLFCSFFLFLLFFCF